MFEQQIQSHILSLAWHSFQHNTTCQYVRTIVFIKTTWQRPNMYI